MTDRTIIFLGRVFAVISIVFGVLGLLALTLFGGADFLLESNALIFGSFACALGVLTWLMIPTQSRNGSVWAVAWAGVFGAMYTGGVAIAVVATLQSNPSLTFDEFSALAPADLSTVASFAVHFRFWAVVPAIWLPLTLGILLFPTGRPPTPRWRWVGWWSLIAIGVATVASALASTPWSTLPISSAENTIPGSLGPVIDNAFLLASLSAVASVVSLVVRYRRSAGIERNQIRWIAWGGAIYLVGFAVGGNFATTPVLDALGGLLAMFALVASYGIAILRYRLYDIDVVISKTVTFGVLAVFITGVYALVVVGLGSLVGGGEPSVVLSIAAVAVVAVVFEPVRRRVQHWANVLVYGKRATPYEVLATATAGLAEIRDPDEALGQVTRLVAEGTGASAVVLWVVVGDAVHPRASSPPGVMGSLLPVGVSRSWLEEVPGDRVVAVRHRGEVLGALSVSKDRGDPVTGADEKLLGDVAAGAGVLVRNLGLNTELVERADELRVSRRRLVAAHDAERHRLERDLHDGAQQQVVAVKVKLGIARTLAEREGADQVAGLVVSLSETVQEAVDGMRAVAHGIYPPLLESEGLEAALGAAKRTVPVPVEIVTSGVGRCARPVEESVYFAVLGIVAQAVDAGATRAVITLDGDSDRVGFTVNVDATPTDLTAVTDRIDALDGTLTTTGEDETVVTGNVPTNAPADAFA